MEFADGTVWTAAYLNSMSHVLRGGDGNDVMGGFDGQNNILIGGKGDDVITGNAGNDVYIWSPGDGNDTINDYRGHKADWYGETGVLKIGEGVDPAKVEITRVGNSLVLIISETGERVTVKDWYSSADYQLTRIEFADGTTWTQADINAMSPVIRGTDGDDVITATSSNDTVIAGDGDDTVYGGAGNDIIAGGAGNDYLRGDDGNDVYVWNPGDGNDTINDHRTHMVDWYGETGALKIGEGVDPAKVEITRSGNNLILIISETEERVTVENWYSHADYQLTGVEFADGTVWTAAYLNSLSPVLRGGDGNDAMGGFDGQNNILIGGGGDDVITGNAGNDVYIWNPGD